MLKYFLAAVLVLGLVMMGPTPESQAKGPGGGGGGGGGKGGGGGGGKGGSSGMHYPSGGRPGYPYYYPRAGYGFGYGSFYYDPFWYGNGNGIPYFGYGYDYGTPPPVYGNPGVPMMPPADQLGSSAQINVVLPNPDTKVWVDGNPMTSGSGAKRIFTSPSLEAGYNYTYRITASWMDNGKEVRMEKVVPIAPGRVSLVDFTSVNSVEPMPLAK